MNKHPEFLLNKIKSPKDLKKLDLKELEQLASEIRTLILEKDAAKGGHLGPDLGIVEVTIAYHYVSMHLKIRLFGMFLTKLIHTRC